QAAEVELTADAGMRENRPELGAEDQPAAQLRVVERLLAHTITGEKKDLATLVPQREREHAVEVSDAVLAEILPRMDKHFGVGAGRETMAASDQTLAQLDVVVDLAVQHRPDRGVLVRNRLVAGFEIDDRQAPLPQRDRSLGVIAFVVGAAM